MKKVSLVFGLCGLLLVNFFFVGPLTAAEEYLDFNFKNTDLKDVLRLLADAKGVNILVDKEVTGKVTLRLKRVGFKEALSLIAQKYQLTYSYQNRVYHISKKYRSFLELEYGDELLSINAVEIRLHTIIRRLNEKAALNLVLDDQLKQQRISLEFQDLALKEGLELILNEANCEQVKNGQITYIKKRIPVATPFSVLYRENLLTIDAEEVPIALLARRITEKTGVSVVVDQDLQQKVTVFFQDLTLAQGLALLGDTNKLQVIKEATAWRITKRRGGDLRVRFANNRLSVAADKVEASLLIQELNRQTGANLVTGFGVQGPITAHFQNLPLTQGLNLLFESQGLIVEKRPHSYYIHKSSTAQGRNLRLSYNSAAATFDLEVQATPLATVLSEMALRANLNLVILSQVNWTINKVRLRQVSFEEALDYLLKGTVFTYKYQRGTYLIGDGLIARPENADFAEIKVYQIKYLKAAELLKNLPPIFNRGNFMQLSGKNYLVVSAPATIQKQFAAYLAQVDLETRDVKTEVFKIKHMKAEDILKLFPPSIPKTDIVAVKETNSLVVTGPQNLINQVGDYLKKVDLVNPMIVFDIMVLSLTNSAAVDWDPAHGINSVIGFRDGKHLNLSPSSGDVVLKNIGNASDVLAAIKLLVTKGQAKILQNPTISTLNGHQVNFNVATKKSYKITTTTGTGDNLTKTESVKTFDTGLFINITPWVSANQQITMKIKPKFSEYGGDTTDGLPSTIERATESTIRVKDHQTVIISGLKNKRKIKTVQKIPLLGDIPLLGYLFKKVRYEDSQDEFLIVITPYLVYDDPGKAKVEKEIRRDLVEKLKD